MPRSGFAIHVSNVILIFINLISPGNFEEFREALFRRNFTIRGGDISFNEKNSSNFRTSRQFGTYPGVPISCYYCNMFYGTAGNYGGDGNYEPDDNYHGFEGQPDWSDFSESGNIQSHGDRVYGGWFAKNGQWPFVVEVYVSGASCTGSLYDVNTIITAAHCVVSEKNVVSTADSVRIYAGSVVHGKGVHRYVESVNPHPKYKPHLGTYLYDIAIIKVTAPYNLSDTIRPIPIKQGVSLPVNTRCIITGFGAITGKPGEAEHNLTYANMRIRSNKLCVDTYGASDYKSAITICAGGLGTSMCYGDSGGPLHCPNPNGHGRVLFGVVSFSYDGDDKNKPCNSPYPGVFVRVPAFHRWIKNCAAGNCRLPTG